MHSRSERKAGSVGARGARCVEANSRAGVMSAVGSAEEARINSISCSRSKEKCREVFSSRSWVGGQIC